MHAFEAWDLGADSTEKFSENQISTMLSGYALLMDIASAYFWQRYEVDPAWQGHFRYKPSIEVFFEGDLVAVNAEASACGSGCCGSDTETFVFPLSHLWRDRNEVLGAVVAEAEAKKRAEEEKKKIEAAKKLENKEAAEKKRLAELIAKYPEAVPSAPPKE